VSSHFNAKSLSFYAIAIGSVLLLFNVVTAYGESKLKAPKTIGGRYQLTLANSLPGCPKLAPLMLQLDQSGTYVNAAILKKEVQNSMSAEEKLTLTGLFQEQLSLNGNVAKSVLCDRPQESGEQAIAITTSEIDGKNLVGEIAINGGAKTPFTGEKIETPNATKSSSH
jgi:hypothetical protein